MSLESEVVEPKKEYACFICGETWSGERGLVLMREEVAISRICLGEKLQEVVAAVAEVEDVVVLLSPRDVACWMCALALNRVDRMEHKLDKLKEAIVEALLKTRTHRHKIPMEAFNPPPRAEVAKKPKKVAAPPPPVARPKGQRGRPPKKKPSIVPGAQAKGPVREKLSPIKEQVVKKMKVDEVKKQYPCRFCHAIYATEVALLSHQLVKHPPKYLCHICDSSFSNETRYKGHMALHLQPRATRAPPPAPDPMASCPSCGLRPLPRDHTCRIKKITCTICKKDRFVDTNFPLERSFECRECSVVPERKEEGEGPLKAELVVDTPDLEQHLLLTPSDERNVDEISQFKCNDCGEEFEFFDLPTHRCFVESLVADGGGGATGALGGGRRTPLRCRTCEEEFDTIGRLRDHWKATGHPRRVDAVTKEVNSITDKSDNSLKTFKVVKQKFEIRTVGSDDSSTGWRGGRGSSGGGWGSGSVEGRLRRTCSTCKIEFLTEELLKKHSAVTGHRVPATPPPAPDPPVVTEPAHAYLGAGESKRGEEEGIEEPVSIGGVEGGEGSGDGAPPSPRPLDKGCSLLVVSPADKTLFIERSAEDDIESVTPVDESPGGLVIHSQVGDFGESEPPTPESLPKEDGINQTVVRPASESALVGMRPPTVKAPRHRLALRRRGVTCWLCEAEFRDTGLLAAHRRRAHRGRPPYQCLLCPTAFTSPIPLAYHARIAHATNRSNYRQIPFF